MEWQGSGAVQVNIDPFEVHLRNDNQPTQGCLRFTREAWAAFLAELKRVKVPAGDRVEP